MFLFCLVLLTLHSRFSHTCDILFEYAQSMGRSSLEYGQSMFCPAERAEMTEIEPSQMAGGYYMGRLKARNEGNDRNITFRGTSEGCDQTKILYLIIYQSLSKSVNISLVSNFIGFARRISLCSSSLGGLTQKSSCCSDVNNVSKPFFLQKARTLGLLSASTIRKRQPAFTTELSNQSFITSRT